MKKHFILPVLLVLFLFSCQKENTSLSPLNPSASESDKTGVADISNADEAVLASANTSTGGYIYTESNDGDVNKIVIYKQNAAGKLSWWKEVTSGGKGTGAGLGSQGAVCMSDNHQWLFAVNAGSNSFSVFKVQTDGGLILKGSVTSLGEKPTSITVHGKYLYVLNNASSTISGFTINNGVLTKMSGSPHTLSGLNVDAPQIMFSPDGSSLIVTEKNTNIIGDFKLDASGDIASVVYNQSTGAEPFGFSYARNYLVVSDAMDGACTSYKEHGSGTLHAINGAVPSGQAAPCWVATTRFGFYAYVANATSNTVSSYYVNAAGALSYISSVAAETKPLDIVVSADNRYVFNINAGSQTIVAFKRASGGALKLIGDVQLAPYAAGLVTYNMY